MVGPHGPARRRGGRAIVALICLCLALPGTAHAEDRLPLQGIWRVEDTGNPKHDSMTVVVYTKLTDMQAWHADTPATFRGVRWLEDGSTASVAGRLNRAGDGAITSAFGQFEFCNCVKLEYRLMPSGHPNMMVGEWSYDGKGPAQSGRSVWRRAPAAKLETVYHRLAGANAAEAAKRRDPVAHGTRPTRVELAHPARGRGVVLGIDGARLAGGHNLWIDPATDIAIDYYRSYWRCADGSRVRSDSWHRCGSNDPLADTVVGLDVRMKLGERTTPGPKALWLDNQEVPFNLVILSHPSLARTLDELAELLIEEGDPQNAAIKKHPYTTDPDEITGWRDRLAGRFDLTDAEWERLIADYFYGGPDNRHHQWQGFEAYLDTRAVSAERAAEIEAVKSGFDGIFGVPGPVFDRLSDAYAHERLLDDGFSDEYREDFLPYAFDRLLDEKGLHRRFLDEEAVRRLSAHEWTEPEEETIPAFTSWTSANKRWGCSYSEVLERMKRADHRFRMTWNMYMTQPVAITASASGPQGAAINHKRNILHNGVLLAMKECEKSVH